MTVLSAQSIRVLCSHSNPRLDLVSPFSERAVSRGLSYGLSCCMYDVRIAQDVRLWPKCNRLASTIEHFYMPDNVMASVHDKSSWARRFVDVKNTIIDPGWRGYLTLELSNRTWSPIFIRRGTPIAQVVFTWLDETTVLPYRGKYQDQENEPVSARDELDAVQAR